MTVRRLLDDGDIATNGTHFINGIQETALTVRTRLRLLTGEYFRNIDEGTPWFDRVFPNTANQTIKETEVKRIITRTPNVGGITQFDLDFDRAARRISITCAIVDNSGERAEIIINEVF